MSRRSLDDPELERIRLEALTHVHQYGSPILRTPSAPVREFGAALRGEVARMTAIMHDARGVGLAAPQVGRLHRLIVIRPSEEMGPLALCNPEIAWRSDEEEVDTEGCLSIGEVSVPVARATAIVLHAQNVDGEAFEFGAEGFAARVIQHEIDHLDGVLILDRTTPEARREALGELRGALATQ